MSAGCGDLVIQEADTSVGADADVIVTSETSTCTTSADCNAFSGCLSGSCVDSSCLYTLKPNTCFIDEACYQAGQEEPGNRCRLCNPTATAEAFVNRECDAGTVCDPATGECIDSSKVPVGGTCVVTDDCAEGACVTVANGTKICGGTCGGDGDCSFGLVCGNDGMCTDQTARLCRPCGADSECATPGLAGARCVRLGAAGSYCGVACAVATDCPSGYVCDDPDGMGSQCVPASGECACNGLSVADGAQTACGLGACAGTRQCAAGGLTVCDGGSPATEVCDSVDNNCDGDIDEPFKNAAGILDQDEHCGTCGNSCADAVANGTAACVVDGATAACQLQACDSGYVESAPGVCTPAVIDPEQCKPCQSAGECVAGAVCAPVGSASFCIKTCALGGSDCDPGFSCEDIDGTGYCLLATGGCAAVGASCSDDAHCEDLDSCTTGMCAGGACAFAPLDCTALDSACGTGTCDNGACVVTATGADGATCDDGDDCTLTDVCASGLCAGTTLDCSGLDAECVQGTCQDGACVGAPLPCGVTDVRLHIPTAAATLAPSAGGTVGYCGSFGHGQPVSPGDGSGWSIGLGFAPGVVTP